MTQQEFTTLNVIRSYYDKIYQKTRELKAKIYETEGWIFVNHTYTQAELLRSPEFNTIFGIMNNLSNQVDNWGLQSGGYSYDFYLEYSRIREDIIRSLKQLEDEIIYRKPTNWERIKEGVSGLIAFIMRGLPNIVLNALGYPTQNTQKSIGY